jgi:hypothetical protein
MTFLAMGFWQVSVIVLVILFPVWALISVFRHEFSGNDQTVWIVVIILVPFLGALLYFLKDRPGSGD